MGKLTDILRQQGRLDDADSRWESHIAAEDDVLPRGNYVADIVKGEAYESSGGHPAYKMTFEVAEGDLKGRRFWHDAFFSAKAEGRALRDVAKLGVPVGGTKAETYAALDQPLPATFRCNVKLAIRRGNDGNEWNDVRWFEVTKAIKPEADPFAPAPQAEAPQTETRQTESPQVDDTPTNDPNGWF